MWLYFFIIVQIEEIYFNFSEWNFFYIFNSYIIVDINVGASKLVLKPTSTEEVCAILKYCNEQRLAVCPQSGNTGLVGGSNPIFDEIVISLKLMNKILDTNELTGRYA